MKIACVTGDDITDELDKYENETVLEDGTLLKEKKDVLISANVYMGAEGITKALEEGADLVITGRVSDPALTIGPLVHEFGWNITDNPDQMGQAGSDKPLDCGFRRSSALYRYPRSPVRHFPQPLSR